MVGSQTAVFGIPIQNCGIGAENGAVGFAFAGQHTKHGGNLSNLVCVVGDFAKVRLFGDLGLDFCHDICHKCIHIFCGVSTEENTMVFQENQIGALAVLCLEVFNDFQALHSQNVAGLGAGYPNGAGEQTGNGFSTVYTAGNTVNGCRMYMKNKLPIQKIVQCSFHAGTTGLTLATGIHHIRQNFSFPHGGIFGILFGPNHSQSGPVHHHKVFRLNGGKGGAGTLDIKCLFILKRGVAAACQNKFRIAAVLI